MISFKFLTFSFPLHSHVSLFYFLQSCTFLHTEGNIYYRPACVSLRLVRIYCCAAALLYALDPFLPGTGRLSRAEEGVSDGTEGFGFAGGAGLKSVSVLVDMPRDVEGVALAVAKPVDDGAAQASFLVDGLLERLCLAPVQPQVPTLRDVQRLLTGLQHLIGCGRGPIPARNESTDRRLLTPVRFIRAVFVWVWESALKGRGICTPRRAEQQRQNYGRGH